MSWEVVVTSDSARWSSSRRSSASSRTDSTSAGDEPIVGRPRLPRRAISASMPLVSASEASLSTSSSVISRPD